MSAYIIWQESINLLQSRHWFQARMQFAKKEAKRLLLESYLTDGFVNEYCFSAIFNQMLGRTQIRNCLLYTSKEHSRQEHTDRPIYPCSHGKTSLPLQNSFRLSFCSLPRALPKRKAYGRGQGRHIAALFPLWQSPCCISYKYSPLAVPSKT